MCYEMPRRGALCEVLHLLPLLLAWGVVRGLLRGAVLATVVCLLVMPCQGQVIWDSSHTGYSFMGYDASKMTPVWNGGAVTGTVTQLSNGINMTYDATILPVFPYPDPDASLTWDMDFRGCFDVGPIPVRATLTQGVNGKLVNGGGDSTNPSSYLTWNSYLYYDLDHNHDSSGGDVGVLPFNLTSSTSLAGNGLIVVDSAETMSSSFILAPEYHYVLRCVQNWAVLDLPTSPMSSTFEAGGDTSFTGITLTLEATPVPEPATLSLLLVAGLGALGAARRSRRAGN